MKAHAGYKKLVNGVITVRIQAAYPLSMSLLAQEPSVGRTPPAATRAAPGRERGGLPISQYHRRSGAACAFAGPVISPNVICPP